MVVVMLRQQILFEKKYIQGHVVIEEQMKIVAPLSQKNTYHSFVPNFE